jgi:hypothetical protein
MKIDEMPEDTHEGDIGEGLANGLVLSLALWIVGCIFVKIFFL